MKYAVSVPAFGDFANPHFLVEAARMVEAGGWDGFFIWDHVFYDPSFHPMIDPWIGLSAVAMATTRLRIGAMVTPLARRRPWIVARQAASLDQLSNGRLTMGVGLGDPAEWDYGFFHEETDPKIRAAKLDESLDILTGLWTGEDFSYQGTHYQLEKMRFLPKPVQSPRIPIWVGGTWDKAKPKARAARYDGYFPLRWQAEALNADEWRAYKAYFDQHRPDPTAPFDFIHSERVAHLPEAEQRAKLEPLAEAGVTWVIEPVDPWGLGEDFEAHWTPDHTRKMMDVLRLPAPKV